MLEKCGDIRAGASQANLIIDDAFDNEDDTADTMSLAPLFPSYDVEPENMPEDDFKPLFKLATISKPI